MSKISKITVQGIEINIDSTNENDYICLTDMVKAKEDDSRAADIIKNWIRSRGTIEFLGAWEGLYNPNFKVVEFDHFKKEAGLPLFTMSVSNWVEKTNAIGIFSKKGKYGGTYAHKDIAFEFGAAISPVFKLYVIKEYQRLKEIETNQYGIEWDIKRVLAKANYRLHTDAVKSHIIPKSSLPTDKQGIVYAEEAEIVNVAVFGCTSTEWKSSNPSRVLMGENLRDIASINELTVLSNIESLNSMLIKQGVDKTARLKILSEQAQDQKKQLDGFDFIKSMKKESTTTYIDAKEIQQSAPNIPPITPKNTSKLNTNNISLKTEIEREKKKLNESKN